METFKKSLDNFFKWVKGTELVELTDIDVSEDPVRPELDLEYRTSYGRKIYGLKYQDNIEGIVCVAFTNDVPQSIRYKSVPMIPVWIKYKFKRKRHLFLGVVKTMLTRSIFSKLLRRMLWCANDTGAGVRAATPTTSRVSRACVGGALHAVHYRRALSCRRGVPPRYPP